MSRTSERDQAIALERALGRSRSQVAARHGVTVKTVSRATKRASAAGHTVAEQDLAALAEYRARVQSATEELGLAREHATNPRSIVASIRAQSRLLSDEIRLMVSLGILGDGADFESMVADVEECLLQAARRDGLDRGMQCWLQKEFAELARRESGEKGTSASTKVSREPSRIYETGGRKVRAP